MLTTSAAPSTASASSESAKLLETPNTTVAAPKTITDQKRVGPIGRTSGWRARTIEMASAPTAGAERRSPRPTGPAPRMSRA